MAPLEKIVIGPKDSANASVIWLHGLGADGNDFVPIVPELQLPVELKIRFVFPHAPVRPVTLNGGFPMRAWFDIYELAELARQDEEGIRSSQQAVNELLQAEQELGVASERIVLAGFSQGAAMALHCGLRYAQKLAGILALSGFLPLTAKLAAELVAANQRTPILMLHGTQDEIIPLRLAEVTKTELIATGCNVKWQTYQVAHGVCEEEITTIAKWLREILG